VRLLRPLPRRLARTLSLLVLIAWAANMVLLARHVRARSGISMAADLAGYAQSAQWRGIYYRGDKIGFSVSQTTPLADGYEMREDGRLQMTLLGSSASVRLTSRVAVDPGFRLRRFSFSIDPGTGPTVVDGTLEGTRLELAIRTPSGDRRETRQLAETPMLALNLPRALVARGLRPGATLQVPLFDPLTLRNSPVRMEVQGREVVSVSGRPVPAFVVISDFSGVRTRTWISDVGETLREESPTGLLVVRESAAQAQALAVPGTVRSDLLQASALVPPAPLRIDDATTVMSLRVRLTGLEPFSPQDLDGNGQRARGGVIEVTDPRDLPAGPRPPDLDSFLQPEPFVESDSPAIRAAALEAARPADPAAVRAERLVRHVHALVEKRPTLSLPSALEVLRSRVGDCNEHTVLYVALARALGLPSRIAVGLVQLRGAFYYHAWPEVWVDEGKDGGRWLSVDPTLNQYPADATHVRLARGGLDRQVAILGMIGRASVEVLEVRLRPGSTPVLVGRAASDLRPLDLALPRRERDGCWSSPRRTR
jgi:transglutaminase-like putative cysteine protease